MALPICAEFIIRFFFEVVRFMLEHLLLTLILFLILITGRVSWIIYAGIFLTVNVFEVIPIIGEIPAIILAPMLWALATLNSPAHWGLKLLGLFPMMIVGLLFQIITTPTFAFTEVLVNIVKEAAFVVFNYFLYKPNRNMSNLLLVIPSILTIIGLLLSSIFGINLCSLGNSALIFLGKGREFLGFQEPGFLTKTVVSLIKGASILP